MVERFFSKDCWEIGWVEEEKKVIRIFIFFYRKVKKMQWEVKIDVHGRKPRSVLMSCWKVFKNWGRWSSASEDSSKKFEVQNSLKSALDNFYRKYFENKFTQKKLIFVRQMRLKTFETVLVVISNHSFRFSKIFEILLVFKHSNVFFCSLIPKTWHHFWITPFSK